MCGSHRKRQATEDEDEALGVNQSPDSPYGVFLSSLRAKTKGASLLQEGGTGQPVVVYTGAARKPGDPIPTTADVKPKKASKSAKTKSKSGSKAAAAKSTSEKDKDGASKAAAHSDGAPAARTKTKKPAPKTSDATSKSSQQTSQTR